MDLNVAIGIVRRDLSENHKLGSNFQFWVSMLTRTIKKNTSLSEEEAHNLAIECVLELGY